MLKITRDEAYLLFVVKQRLLDFGNTSLCPFREKQNGIDGNSFQVCRITCKVMFKTLRIGSCPCWSFTIKYKVRKINEVLKANGYDIKTGKYDAKPRRVVKQYVQKPKTK